MKSLWHYATVYYYVQLDNTKKEFGLTIWRPIGVHLKYISVK